MLLVLLIDGWEMVVEMEVVFGILLGNLVVMLDCYNVYVVCGVDFDFYK